MSHRIGKSLAPAEPGSIVNQYAKGSGAGLGHFAATLRAKLKSRDPLAAFSGKHVRGVMSPVFMPLPSLPKSGQ